MQGFSAYGPSTSGRRTPKNSGNFLQINTPEVNRQSFYSKRRTQSESLNSAESFGSSPNCKSTQFLRSTKSASPVLTPPTVGNGKLPLSAFTCAELEATVSKKSMMLTCAEVEALNSNKSSTESTNALSESASVGSFKSQTILSSSPLPHCSSPVPSVSSISSGYESCPGDVFFTDAIDSTLLAECPDVLDDSGVEIEEKKTASKSLLALFEAITIPEKPIVSTPLKTVQAAVPLAPLSPLMKCPPATQSNDNLPSGIPLEFVVKENTENIHPIMKSHSTPSVKNPSPHVKSEGKKKKPNHNKNTTPAAKNATKKTCRKTVSTPLPPSPVTVMPVMASAPVALSLPPPPVQWEKPGDSNAKCSAEKMSAGVDITLQIKALVGVA